jgi:hypothetical protein
MHRSCSKLFVLTHMHPQAKTSFTKQFLLPFCHLFPTLPLLLQVPLSYHLLSCTAFGTAFALDLLAVAFYAKSSRLELTLLPAWIKGLPFLSSCLMASGKAVLAEAANGRL